MAMLKAAESKPAAHAVSNEGVSEAMAVVNVDG
jgi:hypothetical protein